MYAVRRFIIDYWRLMRGRPLLGEYDHIEIRGPAVDALNNRKDCDDGPSEEQVTADGRAHFRKYGPADWPEEWLHKVYEMGREK